MSYQWRILTALPERQGDDRSGYTPAEVQLNNLERLGWEIVSVQPFTNDPQDSQSVLITARREVRNDP